MQLPDPSSSQPWAEKILWMLGGGTLVGLAAVLRTIFNWRKPKSEAAKLDAETEQTQAETAIKLSGQIIVLHNRLNLMEADYAGFQRESAETIKFYRTQIVRFEELDLVYRQRSHAVNSELGRLGLHIRELESRYSELAVQTKMGETLAPVQIKTYDEIVKDFPLPTAAD